MKNCTRLLTIAVSSILAVSSAFAQETTRTWGSPQDYVPAMPYSECYAALGGGAGWSSINTKDATGAIPGTVPLAGNGTQINLNGGCDLHFSKAIVGGYAGYTHGDVVSSVMGTDLTVSRQIAYGVRIGYMVQPYWMMYAKLGAANGHVSWTEGASKLEESLRGIQAGIGTEIMVTKPLWIRLEGMSTFYNSTTLGTDSLKPTVHSGMIQAVIKF